MVYKAQEGWRTFSKQAVLCLKEWAAWVSNFMIPHTFKQCNWSQCDLHQGNRVVPQTAGSRGNLIFISILASLALKSGGTSTAMHLVSIIYLFISASRFGPGCYLNWCLTKWQPFLLQAGAANASVSALWVQLPVPAVVPNSLLHGHSERIRCTLKSQLTAGLETSILGMWFSGGLSSIRLMVGQGDLKGLFWPRWFYELWCYPRAWGWELFLPFMCFFSGWPSWCSKAALCLIYLTSEVMLAFCLCTSKNTAMPHVECTNTVPFTTSDNMQIHMDTRQEKYTPREKKWRRKSQTEPNALDLGTFGDLTSVSIDFDVCGAEEA